VPLTALTVVLFTVFMALMWVIMSQILLRDALKETKTELRITQMHLQDQNAILIRAGIIKPGDLTTGPTNPDKMEIKKDERDTL